MDRYLADIVKNYNNTTQRTDGMKTVGISKDNRKDLLVVFKDTLLDIVSKTKFKVGNSVQIASKKDTFSNKYKNNWSREIFVIYRINNKYLITYYTYKKPKRERDER